MSDWIENITSAIERRQALQSEDAAVQLHRMTVLKEEGEIFFQALARDAKSGTQEIARRLNLPSVGFESPDIRHFRLSNTHAYPVVRIEAELSSSGRRILVNTKINPSAAQEPIRKLLTVEMCVRSDDKLYLCCEGAPLSGLDELLELIVPPLFNL